MTDGGGGVDGDCGGLNDRYLYRYLYSGQLAVLSGEGYRIFSRCGYAGGSMPVVVGFDGSQPSLARHLPSSSFTCLKM